MKQMNIAWLFPDTLYLHGERGNILALQRFAKLAGYEPVVRKIDFDTEDFDPMAYDILFCPPGELASFPEILKALMPLREQLAAFVEAGKVLIATGTSAAMWCERICRTDGTEYTGLGLVQAEAVEKEAVYGDDNDFVCTYHGKEMEIIGNQIQMVDFVGAKTPAFGELQYGYGNTGSDRAEGFAVKNSIFTNTLGPMLVTNPWLTVEIIGAAAEAKGEEPADIAFDAELERRSFETKKAFILQKETRLTNTK